MEHKTLLEYILEAQGRAVHALKTATPLGKETLKEIIEQMR